MLQSFPGCSPWDAGSKDDDPAKDPSLLWGSGKQLQQLGQGGRKTQMEQQYPAEKSAAQLAPTQPGRIPCTFPRKNEMASPCKLFPSASHGNPAGNRDP